MSAVLVKLKQIKQAKSVELAEMCGITERDVNKALYPLVASGQVMACKCTGSKGKSIEYRLTGTLLAARPGRKPGAAV